jgi:hypothetical protein
MYVEDAEGRDHQDRPGGRVHDRVLDHEDAEHVAVALLPGFRAIGEAPLDAPRQRLGLLDVVQAQPDLVDHVDAVLQDLRLLEQSVGLGVVERGDAGIEDAHHLDLEHHAGGRQRGQGIVQARAELGGQPRAQNDPVGGRVEVVQRALDEIALDVGDPALARRIDADQAGGDVLAAVAQDDLAAQHRRDRDSRQTRELHHLGLAVLDPTGLVLRLDPGQPDRAIAVGQFDGLRRRPAVFVQHRDMGRDVDDLGDEIFLEALHHRRDGDEEADAERDPEQRDNGLAPAPAQMGQGDLELQPHGTRSLTVTAAPSRSPSGGSRITTSPSVSPATTSTLVSPNTPSVTARR